MKLQQTAGFNLSSKQEMPSRQQKSAKKGSKRYLMFGPNHILVTLRWDGGPSPGNKETKKSCFSWEMFKMEYKFKKLVKIIVFRCLRANKTVGCSDYSIRFAQPIR